MRLQSAGGLARGWLVCDDLGLSCVSQPPTGWPRPAPVVVARVESRCMGGQEETRTGFQASDCPTPALILSHKTSHTSEPGNYRMTGKGCGYRQAINGDHSCNQSTPVPMSAFGAWEIHRSQRSEQSYLARLGQLYKGRGSGAKLEAMSMSSLRGRAPGREHSSQESSEAGQSLVPWRSSAD